MTRTPSRYWTTATLVIAMAILVWMTWERQSTPHDGEGAVEELFSSQRSGVMVEAEGVVERVLRDDLEGSRHQRFIVRLPSGHTVLVSHNIDLAPRVEDIAQGAPVTFRGQYEWNHRGGVVHWTHHDPDGDRAGGWIDHAGRRYR